MNNVQLSNPFGRAYRTLLIFLEAIKFEHTIFALPFALIGMLYATQSGGILTPRIVGWILVAMVGARTAAMTFNRIADRDLDALNPRTARRALPAGLLKVGQMQFFLFLSVLVFVLAAWQLNPLCLVLSPVALFVLLTYSYTKRFTFLSHFWLGFSLGIAPAAAWIAVRGVLEAAPLWFTAAVTCWVAGFDILYSLQDDEFDRTHGLRSLPQTVGRPAAILISRLSHLCSIVFLFAAGASLEVGWFYYAGVVMAAALLFYEQTLVRADDLSRLNVAFFTMNGLVGIGLFLFALLDVWL